MAEPTTSERELPTFASDRPIQGADADQLGRAGVARELAGRISRWRGGESLVIAVHGPWGSGKTSLKNLVLEELLRPGSEPRVVVQFAPWEWAATGEKQERRFFAELGRAVRATSSQQSARRLATLLEKYGRVLTAGADASDSGTKALNFLLGSAVLAGVAGIAPAWRTVAATGALVLAGWAVALRAFGGLLNQLSKFPQAWLGTDSDDSESLKRKIAEALRKLGKPLLVVVDDLDRLPATQIQDMIRLIKANGDFPGVVYLLLYEKNVVISALDALSAGHGAKFLEKVVQVDLHLPVPQRQQLLNILLTGLDATLRRHGESDVDGVRWANLFVPGIRDYFVTPRDCHRFLNSFGFMLARLAGSKGAEVDVLDLIALETLRVFEPGLYEQLPALRGHLTGESRVAGSQKDMKPEIVAEIDAAFAAGKVSRPDQVRALLRELFPPIEFAFGGSYYGHDFAHQWYQQRRICAPDYFDAYFLLGPSSATLSRAQLDGLWQAASNRETAVSTMRALVKGGQLDAMSDALEAYKEAFDIAHAVPFFTALCDLCDETPRKGGGLFSHDYVMRWSRFLYWVLRRIEDPRHRFAILREMLTATHGLALPASKISTEEQTPDRKARDKTFLIEEKDWVVLRDLWLLRMREAAEAGRVLGQLRLVQLLYYWQEWAGNPEVRNWVTATVIDSPSALQFITRFLSRSTRQGMGDYAPSIQWRIELESLERFADLAKLTDWIRQADWSLVGIDERKALVCFWHAIARRGKKPDPHEDGVWLTEETIDRLAGQPAAPTATLKSTSPEHPS